MANLGNDGRAYEGQRLSVATPSRRARPAFVVALLLAAGGCADASAPSNGDADDMGRRDPIRRPIDPDVRAGCAATTLYDVPDDPAVRGPSPVGARTVRVPLPDDEGEITVEAWYPAVLGSEENVAPREYDLREVLPPGEGAKIPDEDATSDGLICDCYSDLPIDAEHGPYPLLILIHGTASMRILLPSERSAKCS